MKSNSAVIEETKIKTRRGGVARIELATEARIMCFVDNSHINLVIKKWPKFDWKNVPCRAKILAL